MEFIMGAGFGFILAGLYVLWCEKVAVKRRTVFLRGKEYHIAEAANETHN